MSQFLSQISEHVYWMPPAAPDRPSLCAVVGPRDTLMLDAGASAEHARQFLEALRAQDVAPPRFVTLTHWHWDHVFGANTLGVPVIAHIATAERLAALASLEWSDAALDARVASGEETASCADNIKQELPEPRDVRIVSPDIVFQSPIQIRLGDDVSCFVQHVGGDHAADSCFMYVAPDRVAFLGDCLYEAIYAPTRYYTTARLFPVLDMLLQLDAGTFVEGHTGTVMDQREFQALANKLRVVGSAVDRLGADETAVRQAVAEQSGELLDEEAEDFIRAFIAGLVLA